MTAPSAGPSLASTVDAFLEAFNDNDLDRVMTFFAEDAVYRPGNGVERVGRAAIREEFAPQFEGAMGAMRFDEHDRIVDERSRKVVVRWVCRHDLGHARFPTLAIRIQGALVRLLVGDRFGWEGLDVFHLDEAGKIRGKYTYANYTRPRLVRELGVLLPAIPQPRHAGGPA
ncbi:MAG TPA: nuclear transport factor 2 family protein [Anaeromyxobacteraceae bacterium]|nr:nuclear transport factor 2 family protein [Anaeromyxobacteraceae bacterium]